MGLVAGGVGLLIFGILIMIGSVVMMNISQNRVDECRSLVGEVGRFIDPEINNACRNANLMEMGSYIGAAIGLAMLVTGTVLTGVGASRPKKQTDVAKEPSKPEPGTSKPETERRDEHEHDNPVLGGAFGHWDYIGKKLSKNDK